MKKAASFYYCRYSGSKPIGLAFTLIELLVVIAIIAILAAMAQPLRRKCAMDATVSGPYASSGIPLAKLSAIFVEIECFTKSMLTSSKASICKRISAE